MSSVDAAHIADLMPMTSAPRRPAKSWRAPAWLQVVIIAALLGSAVYAAFNGHILLCTLMAVAGVAFAISFALVRMIGDEYGRT